MSDLQPIDVGSRHDLRAARSPDAPDTNGYEGRGATFGWVHSYETGSTVDGPGVRITLSMSGCLLRCQYCHNPDTWHLKDGTKVELAQAVRRLADFAPMLRAMGGGLTISGGEPLVQTGFTGGMLAAARGTTATSVLVATETGMLHQLRRANPAVRWEPVNPNAVCRYMKMTTPEALLRCLRDGVTEVRVDPEIARRARRAVTAMVGVGSPSAAGE